MITQEQATPDQKLGELILYISKKCSSDPNFGATKLNKILYYSDFMAYGHWGESITGAEYQHLKKGPAPRRLIPVRDQLVENRSLAVEPRTTGFGYQQNRTVPLREANLDIFRAQAISLVDDIIQALSSFNATESSELSHREVGWKMTKDGETIPYRSILVSDAPLSTEEILFAQKFSMDQVPA